MNQNQKPTDPVKYPVEDHSEAPDTEHQLPDPLATPELPKQTLPDEELDSALPVVKEEERKEDSSSQE